MGYVCTNRGERSIVIDSRFQVTNTQIIHFLKLTMTSLLISMTIAMVALQFQPQSQSWGKFQLFCFLVALICGDGERLTAKTYSNYEEFMLSVTKVCTVSIQLSEAKIGWKDDEKWKHTLAKYPSLSASVPGTFGICYSFSSSTRSLLF